jgi:glycosyltransferase involved in cell wall biosynthesis
LGILRKSEKSKFKVDFMDESKTINILYLHEATLPKFTKGVTSEGQIRVIRSVDFVKTVYTLGTGENYVGVIDGYALEQKIETIPLPSLKGPMRLMLYYPIVSIALFFTLLTRRINLIHSTSPIWSGPIGVVLGSMFRVPCIIEVRANYDRLIEAYFKNVPLSLKKSLVKYVREFALRNAGAVIANSEYHKNESIYFGVHPTKAFRWTRSFSFNSDLIQQMKMSKSKKFTIGTMCRLVKSKGVQCLLQAVHHLIKSKKLSKSDFQVIIAGDGPYKTSLEGLAEQLGITSNITFVGMVTNTLTWVCKFDILVNPTLELEALGMVNLEAYACKIPVIAFGKNGLPETVKDGKTGIIIKVGDYQLLAEAILKLYADSDLRVSLGNEGYALLLREYLFEKQVTTYESCLKKLLK